MPEIIIIAHNLRSVHNIGSILRSCDGLGIPKVVCSGYTPYPEQPDDKRLPHIKRKISEQIHKTALGAETSLDCTHIDDLPVYIGVLKRNGYEVVALEQAKHSIPLDNYMPAKKTAIIVGREVEGIEHEILDLCDKIVEIPMHGHKESFNVSVAAAIALYHCRFHT